MPKRVRSLALALLACGFVAVSAPLAHAEIDLEFRPLKQQVVVGEVAYIGLYAVSDNGTGQSIGAMNVILYWDPARLELTSFGGGDYQWLKSWFPDDGALDGLNDDCGDGVFCDTIECMVDDDCPDGFFCNLDCDVDEDCAPGSACDPATFLCETGLCPFTGSPFNDGDALYDCWAQWEGPAWATPEGLLVTTFEFTALTAGAAAVEILPNYGLNTRTRVIHGEIPGQEVTGVIGPPAVVNVVACAAPTAEGEGSRYLAATPDADEAMVAILVTGEAQDPAIACVSLYVQADGRLGSTPVYQSPAQWDTVHIADTQIIPSASYQVRVDCNPGQPGTDLSPPAVATTWPFGDVNNDGVADIDDVLVVIDAAQGIFGPDVTIPNVDLAGCLPDGQIDADDIVFVLDAAEGRDFSCPEICPSDLDLEDFAEFLACLAGPGVEVKTGCGPFDLDFDNDVDLEDFSRFETVFAG